MFLKVICICLLIPSFVLSASVKSSSYIQDDATIPDDARIAALYVKDSENGELRFLTSGTGLNSALNQYITQKQNMLEQLRPTTATNNFGTITGSGLGSTGSFVTSGTGSSGSVTPIIVNLGATSATSSNTVASAASASSPIADLLPQIIAQGALGNRRVVGNNVRRKVNRRRRPVGNRNNKPKIVLVRPNRQG
ncbi:uncharacterized protein LOC119667224 [Teleopsis dalmanni]|uniref:uncharacterized protein LOC119667224 n=1 Tax=Teleopsis dalmanni TaxID=139649 RepID=UPI0018CE514B|nr:uncharacterized protein LOC119667224 [Teleopsis dalmanni]